MNLSCTVHCRKCNLLVLSLLVLMCAPVIIFGQMNWLSATSSAEFGKRALLHAVVYNNKMWVLHGWDLSSDKPWADVWYSTTGKNWTRSSTDTVPHDIRVEFATVDFNGFLWVLGGNKGC